MNYIVKESKSNRFLSAPKNKVGIKENESRKLAGLPAIEEVINYHFSHGGINYAHIFTSKEDAINAAESTHTAKGKNFQYEIIERN